MDISAFRLRAEHFEARKREDLGLQVLADVRRLVALLEEFEN
jgi:hypothetical protein